MNQKNLLNIILFLIWPFAAFINTLANIKSKYIGLFFILFAVFLGLNVFLDVKESTGDYYVYVTFAMDYKDVSWNSILLEKDFFYAIIAKILTNISNNYYFISAVFAVCFFALYSKCIKSITEFYNDKVQNYFNVFLFIALILVLPFSMLNAFRFAIALLFYLWCLIEFIINKKWMFLFFILLTPFIHFSFWIFIPLPILYLLLKNKLIISIFIFIVSIVYSSSNIAYSVNNYTQDLFQESVSSRVSNYASEEGMERMNDKYDNLEKQGSINRLISRSISEYSDYILMYSLIIISLFHYKFLISNSYIKNLFVISILAYSLANMASSISNGDRFYTLASAIYFFSLFYMITKEKVQRNYLFIIKNDKLIIILIIVVIINGLNSIYISREIFNYKSLIFGNWLTVLIN